MKPAGIFYKACSSQDQRQRLCIQPCEGREAVITSPTGEFEPFVVHYAETFIVASVDTYVINTAKKNRKGSSLSQLRRLLGKHILLNNIWGV